jgi:hypothetical protein
MEHDDPGGSTVAVTGAAGLACGMAPPCAAGAGGFFLGAGTAELQGSVEAYSAGDYRTGDQLANQAGFDFLGAGLFFVGARTPGPGAASSADIEAYSKAGVVPATAARGGGRAANKLRPNTAAEGAHSTFRTDVQGNITGHAEWRPNPRNPSGFDQAKRVDLTGDPHYNKATGERVSTPHTHGKDIPGGVRPATPDEVPR